MKTKNVQKIFGIGWAKTGTTTLGGCMQILGFNHTSQNLSLVEDLKTGDFSRIMQIAAGFDSFEDWPWLLLFKELDAQFPQSRFILTIRDPESWLKSYRNMLRSQGSPTDRINDIRSVLYGLPFPNVTDAQLLDRFHRHNLDVKEYFRSRSSDLLIVDWEMGHGWNELCSFLSMEIPQLPFPHANRGVYADK